ncbi:DUF1804 family protein [Sinomicrobium kalidii]|uniref:DUF1804 family protein n=1 Tax=Sinomicrobium kalidii TaxID=2900738 RepID=UPI001E296A46|nr:DUF1804 family protein [Sinomicrobium kalidii]UGU15207.1 DUF1804 family protein [Sinomicrobium kalidii]
MAKEKEKRIAFDYIVNQGVSPTVTAQKVGVSERTVTRWIQKEGWKKLRNAKQNMSAERSERIRQVIETLTEQRIELFAQIKQAKEGEDKQLLFSLQKEAVGIDDAISKWNKALENIDKENRVSLSAYLEVMEDIFKHLNQYDPKLYVDTLDFQEQHINTISERL